MDLLQNNPNNCPRCPLKDGEEISVNEAGGIRQHKSYWHSDPSIQDQQDPTLECRNGEDYWEPIFKAWQEHWKSGER